MPPHGYQDREQSCRVACFPCGILEGWGVKLGSAIRCKGTWCNADLLEAVYGFVERYLNKLLK